MLEALIWGILLLMKSQSYLKNVLVRLIFRMKRRSEATAIKCVIILARKSCASACFFQFSEESGIFPGFWYFCLKVEFIKVFTQKFSLYFRFLFNLTPIEVHCIKSARGCAAYIFISNLQTESSFFCQIPFE